MEKNHILGIISDFQKTFRFSDKFQIFEKLSNFKKIFRFLKKKSQIYRIFLDFQKKNQIFEKIRSSENLQFLEIFPIVGKFLDFW